MDDADAGAGKPRMKARAPTMEELRARFGRALRDQNFWTLMEELGMNPEEAPPEVVPFPAERAESAPAKPEGPGRVIAVRFSKRWPGQGPGHRNQGVGDH